MCQHPWCGGLGFSPSDVENMTLYQLRMHATDFTRGRKIDAGEARQLMSTEKFKAGHDRKKQEIDEARREFFEGD